MATDIAETRVPPNCRKMICAGALVAINSSGGKDSQCMTILLSRIVPREQLLIVHAPLRRTPPNLPRHIAPPAAPEDALPAPPPFRAPSGQPADRGFA